MPPDEMIPVEEIDAPDETLLVKTPDIPSSIPPTPLLMQPADVPPAQSLGPLSNNVQYQWNWGAFLFLPVWLIAMKLWKFFWCYLGIVIVCVLLAATVHLKYTNLIVFACSALFAQHGNRLAWKSSRQWESEEQFVATQLVWKRWSIGFLVTMFLVIIIMIVFKDGK